MAIMVIIMIIIIIIMSSIGVSNFPLPIGFLKSGSVSDYT